MDIRHSQLVLISKRVAKANDKINEILTKLNWTRQELKQWQNERKKLQTCPFNKRHLVPESSMKEHYRRCQLKSRGIHDTKKKSTSSASSSSMYFYARSPSTTADQVNSSFESQNIIDTNLRPQQQLQREQEEHYVRELEPLTSIKEKCQAYDQVIQKSHQLRHHSKKEKETDLEIDRLVYEKQKAQKKKLRTDQQMYNKRRRKQYRVKMRMSTPTEIQRELIQVYMQEYEQLNKMKMIS